MHTCIYSGPLERNLAGWHRGKADILYRSPLLYVTLFYSYTCLFRPIRALIFTIVSSLTEITNRTRIPPAALVLSSAQ